jgi:AraC-like DNA-binding protein
MNQVLQSAPPPEPGSVATSLIGRIVRGAVELGANRLALLRHIGIDEARLRNPLGRMPGPVLLHLFAYLIREFNDPLIVIRLGQFSAPRNFSDPGYVTRLSINLGTVITANVALQGARQKMVSTVFNPSLKPPELVWTLESEAVDGVASLVEFSVASFANLAQDVLDEPMQLRQVEFTHGPQADIARYEECFRCPVVFNKPQTKMLLTAQQLFRPSPIANLRIQDAALQRFRKPSVWLSQDKKISAHCYVFLLVELDKSPLKLDRIAAASGMSERTLRRRLVEEGNPFRELLDQVRRDMWELYKMEGTRSLSEIAHLLGYSELSAFTRSHKRWFGYAPSTLQISENGGRSKV